MLYRFDVALVFKTQKYIMKQSDITSSLSNFFS